MIPLPVFPGWEIPELDTEYPLLPDQTLELKTTTDQSGSIRPRFISFDGTRRYYSIYCTDPATNTWWYDIDYCTAGRLYPARSSEVKVWRLTHTLTIFIIECDGVTLLSFWYAEADELGVCRQEWAKDTTGIEFSSGSHLYKNNGHLFMRITGK